MKSVNVVEKFLKSKNHNRIIVLGYLSYILIGTLLLSLPFFKKVPSIGFLDNFFIATSAVSTTGLTTISIADNYNFWGQMILIILIQLGGLGYMTLGSFIILSLGGRLSFSREKIQKHVFCLPDHITITKFIRILVYYSFAVEFIGALLLYIFFKIEHLPNSLWSAVFHSISAFCTSGFSIYNNSLESFSRNVGVNITISALCILGAIGFIIVYDIWNNRIKSKKRISLTSKIILWSTFILIMSGAIVLFFFEPSITGKSFIERLLTSFFQSMTALTTSGFNTIPISTLSVLSYFIITILMIVGASPSGTGGGLKTTTFTALLGVMKSSLSGEKNVKFLNRTIPNERLWLAASSLCFYLLALFLSTFFILLQTNRFNIQQVIFEVASALGTIGLSTGITPGLNHLEKIIIIITMFIGRIGPLSFGMALFLGNENAGRIKYPEEDLA
ncbi:MAG: potassium transporter TrkG [bacterium]